MAVDAGASPSTIAGRAPKIFPMSPATSSAARLTNGLMPELMTIAGKLVAEIVNEFMVKFLYALCIHFIVSRAVRSDASRGLLSR